MNDLLEAKKFVETNREEGVLCPCCGQYARTYKRKITSSMAYGLILMHKETKGEWIHILQFFTERKMSSTNEMAKLRHWGLIEKKDGHKEDGNPCNGFYRITGKGILFCEDMIQVPRFCFIYNDEVNGFSVEETNIKTALGDKFSYSDLLPAAFALQGDQMTFL